MKFTIGWLKEHLDTKFKDNQIIEKLTDVGLEVESFEKISSDLDNFKIAKIINSQQHPNADKLKVCDVDIGEKKNGKSCLWSTQCQERPSDCLCWSWISNSKKQHETHS